MNQYSMLFLQQSYHDSYEVFEKTLAKNLQTWDYVVLTASNDSQAKAYEEQIQYRLNSGTLPAKTQYAVIPDPGGKRCGSGGATLAVLKYIAQRENTEDLSHLRILCIHSGGDSKRVPQYSACGKIFSPVPRTLPDGRRSTLFDEMIIGMAGIAPRIDAGMLVCSGDVLLLFNALQLDFYTDGAAALSIKEHVDTGKNHGVFLGDGQGMVKRCLQKQSVQTLTRAGAVDHNQNVDIDTGAVILSGKLMNALYKLVDTEDKFAAMVNEHLRLSFYADFLYPLAEDSTLEDFYLETPEGAFSPGLEAARRQIWEVLRPYRMKLIRFSPASFLHFGTTGELLEMVTKDMPNYSFLGWSGVVNSNDSSGNFAAYNSYISKQAVIGKDCYIENSDIRRGVVIGEKSIVSGLTLKNVQIPANTVLHGLKLTNERYICRMYGVDDNPKATKWMGHELGETLWTKPLFKVCATMAEAVEATLSGAMDGELMSLMDSFNEADVTAILPWQDKLDDKIIGERILEAVDAGVPAENVEKWFPEGVSQRVIQYLLDEAERMNGDDLQQFSRKIRIYYYGSKLIAGSDLSSRCFKTICTSMLRAFRNRNTYDPNRKIVTDEIITRLPVRVNWGGGWSDTPPYCLENGGTVLNVAITLDGEYPIEVTLRKLEEKKFVLASTDIGSYREFDSLEQLRNCSDPGDPFALHKAALLACGIIPEQGDTTVEQICEGLGGGMYMNTRVINIPKGSGLGTSSILAGACVKGLYAFVGIEAQEQDWFSSVLCMEQLMSTGGGWQDQVGGLTPGIKMATASCGLEQEIYCTPVRLSDDTIQQLEKRFVLIYTGQRRLARNLLREVMGKYIGADPVSKKVLYQIQQLAVLMRFELERGNVDQFAQLLTEHWELQKKLDTGCTNTCIDQIFLTIDDLIDGRMICGAGGGGFLQVMLKKGVSIEDLKKRLDEVFGASGVAAWECGLVLN